MSLPKRILVLGPNGAGTDNLIALADEVIEER
jgi:hypothetical protein